MDIERIDDTGFGAIRVIQKEGLGYGVDAVLLAAFAAGETGASGLKAQAHASRHKADSTLRLADLGSGSGIIGMILVHKLPYVKVLGIEKRADAVDRARRAAELSHIEDRIEFICADVSDIFGLAEPEIEELGNAAIKNVAIENAAIENAPNTRKLEGCFDAVVSNPPYFRRAAAIPSQTADKYIARHETTADIYEWMKASAQLLKPGGDVYLVHRPDRLPDIYEAMRQAGIEPRELQAVMPHPNEAANIVLIHGIKGAGREHRILAPIAVHEANGEYTELIQRIYERK